MRRFTLEDYKREWPKLKAELEDMKIQSKIHYDQALHNKEQCDKLLAELDKHQKAYYKTQRDLINYSCGCSRIMEANFKQILPNTCPRCNKVLTENKEFHSCLKKE